VKADGKKEAAAQLICEKRPEPRAATGVIRRRRRRVSAQAATSMPPEITGARAASGSRSLRAFRWRPLQST